MGSQSAIFRMSGITFFVLLAIASTTWAKEAPVQTVESVDLRSYTGRWYEVARIENEFEIGCSGVTAEYSLNENGTLEVINTCRYGQNADAKIKRAVGRAWITDERTQAKLKVSFVKFITWIKLFSGHYWILSLGPFNENGQYEYALVGDPKRKYGWVLARKPELSESVLNEIFAQAERQGYDRKLFQRTNQSIHVGSD